MLAREETGRKAEANEVAVWRDMMAAMPEEVRAQLNAACLSVGGALVVAARNLPAVTFNRAFGIGIHRAPTLADLIAIAEAMRKTSSPVAQLQVAPLAENLGAEPLLGQAGFKLEETRWVKMARRTEDAPSFDTDLRIEIATAQTAGEFAAVVRQGFGLPSVMDAWLAALASRPRWLCLIARKEGVPAAAASMFFDAGCAWFGMAATLPEFRRHGGQGALLARRIAEAAARGIPWVFTETGLLPGRNPSFENMRRAGFGTLHERRNWVLPC